VKTSLPVKNMRNGDFSLNSPAQCAEMPFLIQYRAVLATVPGEALGTHKEVGMSIRPMVLTVVLALCAASAHAGTVTWQFVETTGGSGPGTIGGLLTLNSPPIDLTPGVEWVAITGDAVDLQVLDPVIGPVGHYDLVLTVDSELEGIGPSFISIDTVITGLNATSDVAFTEITAVSDLGVGTAAGGGPVAFGDWVLASAAVPEPSSLALAGTAALAGLVLWSSRRRGR
jgi:hypothetical protein